VPFHVEISGSLNHARAFNLSDEEVRETVVRPWLAAEPVSLGERDWEPSECSLRVLEGPHLEAPDLAFGQGWSNAERSAVDVTRRLLEQTEPIRPPDAFVVPAEVPEATVAEMLSGREAHPVSWEEARRSAGGHDPEVAAVIIVTRR
jgi:hypothetical protein